MQAQRMHWWWGWGARGTVALLLGLAAGPWTTPGAPLPLLIGAYVHIDGLILLTLAATRGEAGAAIRPLLAAGLGGAVGGLGIVLWPFPGGLPLDVLLAAWTLLRGGVEMVVAQRAPEVDGDTRLFVLTAALSIGFGVLLLSNPGISDQALRYGFGTYAVLAGACQIATAHRVWFVLRSARGAPTHR
jgi:uncharacterized membrane protein HdeD (DUF308 family)